MVDVAEQPVKTALLTGGGGFVGSRLAARLASEGWRVHSVLRAGSEPPAGCAGNAAIVTHAFDGTTESLVSLVGETRPDVVFHLASLFLAQHAPGDVAPLVASNILFGTQLAEAMARNGITRLVNTGTSWQHFEDAPYNPVCLYAATKQAFEDILAYYVETAGFRIVTLKLFDTYGPGDPRPKLFRLLRDAAEQGVPLAMSPGEQLIDLVYVDDAVEAFLVAARRLLAEGHAGHARYAVPSGRPIRLRDFIALYARLTGVQPPIRWGERPYRPREVMAPWATGTPLPGWRPATSLEDGIRKTVAPS